ncbi:MAG TPA: precorrin-2 C(20)-methyltransferase [Solirubrobacteraceae bacterium]|nr:precorrin-2 C(20)-methyltransferase [Solirubrobacteraceae bacterium]
MTAGRLIGVGVGPGDPEHLTLKALHALQGADRVFVPETDTSRAGGDTGRAERIVAPHVDADRIERLLFAMRDDAARAGNWDRAGDAIAAVVRDGGTAAFATIGDPNLYSTFGYVAQTVRDLVPEVEVSTIPGITALQDLAARSGTILAEGDERLALVPWPAGEDRLRDALDGFDTVVVYKGGRHLPQVLDTIRDAGRLEGAVYGEQLGLGDAEVVATAEARDGSRGPYMSTVIVPRRVQHERGGRL